MKKFSFLLMFVACFGFFLTFCEKGESIVNPTDLNESQIVMPEGEFKKELKVEDAMGNYIIADFTTDNEDFFNSVTSKSFSLEASKELYLTESNSEDEPLNKDLVKSEEVDLWYTFIIKEEHLLPGIVGYSTPFNHEANRYDCSKKGWQANTTKNAVWTSQTTAQGSKCNYYDLTNGSWVWRGYRSLCSVYCNQKTHTFSRQQNGVAIFDEYWCGTSNNFAFQWQ